MKVSKTIYLSGPMRGYKEFNFPEFYQKADDLRELGYNVINPAENFGGNTDLPYEEYMKLDIRQVTECDGIAMMKGWEQSQGAKIELLVAQTCGLSVYCAETLLLDKISKRMEAKIIKEEWVGEESILQEADRLVNGDRQSDYGHPIDDFKKTAKIWTGVLMDKLKDGEEVSPRDVPLCMVGVKISREVNKPKRDNRVDGCGYFQTLDMVDEKLKD